MRLLIALLLGVSPWLTTRRRQAAILAGISTVLLGAAGVTFAQSLPTLELTAGMHRIEAEVAYTQETRMVGLMQRKAMPVQRGMLFVFDADARHCMWMKNTLLPLAVAFLDAEGRIINIEEMKPQTEDNHCAAKPARYALEMNAGWFKSRGFGPGVTLRGIDRAPPPR